MSFARNILDNWDTPEVQEMLKRMAEEYAIKQDLKRRKKEKMLSNTDYVNWLINFTSLNNDCFADDDWLYCPNQISKIDNEKVNDLYILYEGIFEYAEENDYVPKETEFGNEYMVRVNDIGLKIGIAVGQGTHFYCQILDIDNEKEFIDFFDMINKKNNSKTLKKKK